MSLNDPLANALSTILNHEKIGKKECILKPISKTIKVILTLMKENGYIGDFEEIKDNKGNLLKINLLNRINKCGAIKPRYAVKKNVYEKFEKRFLPAKDVGILLVSTSSGIMTHYDSKKKKLGGKLLSYCY